MKSEGRIWRELEILQTQLQREIKEGNRSGFVDVIPHRISALKWVLEVEN